MPQAHSVSTTFYGILLAPCFSYYHRAKQYLITIELKRFADLRKLTGSWYSNDYAHYLSKQAEQNATFRRLNVPTWDTKPDPSKMTAEELAAGEIIFEREKRLEELQYTPHPNSLLPYLLQIAPCILRRRSDIDWSMLDCREGFQMSALLQDTSLAPCSGPIPHSFVQRISPQPYFKHSATTALQ